MDCRPNAENHGEDARGEKAIGATAFGFRMPYRIVAGSSKLEAHRGDSVNGGQGRVRQYRGN